MTTLAPFFMGRLRIDVPVVLAPMAGYTEAAMRTLCMRHHCGAVLTEVVSADALVRGSRLTWHMLETSPVEHPAGAHLYGIEPDVMAAAAARVEAEGRFDFIDINAGCPVRKMVARGAGAALMRDPDRMARIVRAIKQAVSLPVTVKTRTGLAPDQITIREVAQAVEEAGADALTIHGRVASVHHRGPADWGLIAQIKSERRLPVIGNGGVESAADVFRMRAETSVDGVMIGRAAVGNPWIFDEVFSLAAGHPYTPPTPADLRAAVVEQLTHAIALQERELVLRRRSKRTADAAAALHFRAHLVRYLSGCRDWVDVRRRLNTMASTEAVLQAVDEVMARQPAAQRVLRDFTDDSVVECPAKAGMAEARVS